MTRARELADQHKTLDVDGGTIKLDGNYPVGTGNVALGDAALNGAITGSYNVTVGQSGLTSLTSGSYNSAFGQGTLASNTSGSSNVAVGTNSLLSNTTADNNTAVGYQAGYSNTTGGQNTLLGNRSGYSNTVSSYNVFLGYEAGYSFAGSSGNTFNTFVGVQSGYSITTGTRNTIIGGYNGNQNSLDIRTSNNNIVLSDGDGNPRGIFDSSGRFMVGGTSPLSSSRITTYESGNCHLATRHTSATAGYHWRYEVDSSNTVYIINQSSAGVYMSNGATSWSSLSDETSKNIIEPITNAVEKVSSLRTVIGSYKSDAAQNRRPFLIAQDVQAVLPEAVTVANQETGELGLSYSDTIPLLVAAIKEQQETITALTARIEALETN